MKKIVKITALTAIALGLFASCGTTKEEEKSASTKSTYGITMPKNRPEIIDYQGSELGIDIPGWVLAVANGDTQAALKDLKLTDQQGFIITAANTNLDMLKDWTDHVSVETEVAGTMTRSVATAVQSAMSQRQDISDSERETKMTQYAASLSAVELNGLMKSAQFWTQTRQLKQGVDPAKANPEDWQLKYHYYVIYTMDKTVFQKQLNAALNGVEDNASEGAKLKEMISNKLQGIVMPTEEEEE